MLVRPAGFDPQRKYPLFVMIHGGPHTMFRDNFFIRWNYHLIAARDYVLLLTNYRGSTGLGEAFAQSIQGDPLKGPGDDLNAAADEAIRRFPFIDAERQCAGGASYGGHLANWLQASTTRYRCLISHAGLVNLESQWGTSDTIYGREVMMGGPPWKLAEQWSAQNPIDFAANFRTPVLVTVGELDYRVPLNNTLEYWSALQRQRVESRLIVFPDENHWIQKGENSRYFYGEVRDWLERFIGPAAAASSAP
jgi:dipeptidyl aminopeptidase/acylaminoacyl peptidase